MSPYITHIEIILYVNNQAISSNFYQKILRQKPSLETPGMTEFRLTENCKLGLMPNEGIAQILANQTPHPKQGNGIPRCELYLQVNDLLAAYNNALLHGAKLVSPIANRDWGDNVCYFADPDGHIIAFATAISFAN